MKILIIILSCVFLFSCGSSNNNEPPKGATTDGGAGTTETCKLPMTKNMKSIEIAKAFFQLAKNCELTETQIVQIIEREI